MPPVFFALVQLNFHAIQEDVADALFYPPLPFSFLLPLFPLSNLSFAFCPFADFLLVAPSAPRKTTFRFNNPSTDRVYPIDIYGELPALHTLKAFFRLHSSSSSTSGAGRTIAFPAKITPSSV